MVKVAFSDFIGVAGIALAILLVVLDKAGKLKGGWLYGLLIMAAVMTLFIAVGNEWVLDAPAKWRIWRGLLMCCMVGLGYSGVAIWIATPGEMLTEKHAEAEAQEPLSSKPTETGVPTKEPARHTRETTRKIPPAPVVNGQTLGNSPQIQAAIRKVLSFPNAAPDSTAPPTMVEALVTDQTPRKLFNVLMQYDENAVGDDLRGFLHRYYQFEQDTGQFENELLEQIGGIVTVRFRQAWAIYLKYAMLRFSGMSKEQVIAGGNFLNYQITWEDTERVYGQLSSDPPIAKKFSTTFSQYANFVEITTRLRASGQ